MPLEADAATWWDDPDLHAVRQRIERRRAREASGEIQTVAGHGPRKRGVREVHSVSRLTLVPTRSADADADAHAGLGSERRRSRPHPRPLERLGPRPDIIAAWAVVLGVVLMVVAILTAHG